MSKLLGFFSLGMATGLGEGTLNYIYAKIFLKQSYYQLLFTLVKKRTKQKHTYIKFNAVITYKSHDSVLNHVDNF